MTRIDFSQPRPQGGYYDWNDWDDSANDPFCRMPLLGHRGTYGHGEILARPTTPAAGPTLLTLAASTSSTAGTVPVVSYRTHVVGTKKNGSPTCPGSSSPPVGHYYSSHSSSPYSATSTPTPRTRTPGPLGQQYYAMPMLERSSSQPSLTHTTTTTDHSHSDTQHRAPTLVTPHTSTRDLGATATTTTTTASTPATSASYPVTPHTASMCPAPTTPYSAPPPTTQFTPDDDDFSARRNKRLSISRSLQSLRDRAKADKARRRASTVTSPPDKITLAASLPPVPSVPGMYRSQQGQTLPIDRRVVSEKAPQTTTASGPTGRPTPPSAPTTPSKGGLGKFFRRLTGGGKDKSPNGVSPSVATKSPGNTKPSPLAATNSPNDGYRNEQFSSISSKGPRREKRKPVPQVEPPASVRGMLAELDASSRPVIQRRATNRRSALPPSARTAALSDDQHAAEVAPELEADPRYDAETVADEAGSPSDALAALTRHAERGLAFESDRTLSPQLSADSGSGKIGPATPPSESRDAFPDADDGTDSGHGHGNLVFATPEHHRIIAPDDDAPLLKSVPASPVAQQVVTILQQPDFLSSDEEVLAPARKAVSSNGHSAPQSAQHSVHLRSRSASESSSQARATPDSIGRLQRARRGLADFGAYDSDGSDVDEDMDIVHPLRLRIPVRSGSDSMAPTSVSEPSTTATFGPGTASGGLPVGSSAMPPTPTTAGECIETPTSSAFDHSITGHSSDYHSAQGHSATRSRGHGSQSGHSTCQSAWSHTTATSPRDARFAGSSPPRQAPIGDGLSTDGYGGRSKVRLAGASLRRKLSTRPKQPPTSFDAYAAKQRELANARQSCKPTLHSQASIAAEMREVKDKDEVQTMETFFLS